MTPILRVLAFAFLALVSSAARAALQPFGLPWNDATPGLTNLQPWQGTTAGDAGWVSVTPGGHYQVGGQRIRFIGVNIADVSCFPSHAQAEGHAARLARFGFNAVRFHHMEAQWAKSSVIIDYSAGNSRTLSADRLERLHYFVAQLASHGIYSNINLLVSREFQVGDGLGPEITQLGWKDQHILGFFLDDMLALHKEHARKLLTAPNPYRGGRSLAQDPAVAVVEIMNENGLLQKWYENVLDTLPAPYRLALQAKWNAWLKTRYATTADLLTSWGVINEPLGNNRLLNGDFAAGTNSWNRIEQISGAVASTTTNLDFNGGSALRINVTSPGAANWHVQFTQSNQAFVVGQVYTLSFWAKSSGTVPLTAAFTRTGPDWSGVGSRLDATLGTDWQRYTMTFEAPSTEPSVRLVFNGFGDRVCSVSLADVRFQTGGRIGGLADGVTLEAGNIPAVLHNAASGSATAGQTRDWITYVFSAEKAYWDAMHAHIKDTLGYPGIVWGTIIANSPPNAQAGLDAMDSHAYWQHPQWPAGKDWDPVDWTLGNVSMVNLPSSNTLTGIARQRVEGRPHNVTEYQHASPNTYASEAPLLVAAYGALQDWDSLWMFAYDTDTDEAVSGFFDHGGHSGKMVNQILAATLFRRGDVAPASLSYTLPFTPAAEVEAARTAGAAWSIADGSKIGMPALLALQSRVALSIGEDATGLAAAPATPTGSVFTSDTGQLRWDTSVAAKGVITVNSPRTKAVIGFTAGRSFDLGGVVIASGTTRQDWSTIGITLLEGNTFNQAGAARAVIVATGDQENTGQVWKDTATRTSVGSNWGTAPVLVETVPATITLPVAADRLSVWALDVRGQRTVSVPVRAGNGQAQFDLGQSGVTLWYEIAITAGPAAAATIATQPAAAQSIAPGSNATLAVNVDGSPTPALQWFRNGTALPGATSPALSLENVQPADTGLYRAVVSNPSATLTSASSILGVASTAKVVGTGDIVGSDIQHPNGNIFDQVLLTGSAEAITADHLQNQITRTSFIDLDHDIVQVEFSGPGTLSLVLDTPSPPAAPVNYNQATAYMKGHAGIVITGADERSNVSVFSVGRKTAVNQALFKDGVAYDGIADIAFIAIASTNGKFGGVRTANANYFAAKGLTGLYAPGVAFAGPVYLGNVTASDSATPVILLGSAAETRITGGDLWQANSQPVQVSGLTALKFTAGSDSHGKELPAQANRAVLVQDGRDVTGAIVVYPVP